MIVDPGAPITVTVGLRHSVQLNPSDGDHSGSLTWSDNTTTVNISPGHNVVSVTERGTAGGITFTRIESLDTQALLKFSRIYKVVSCKVKAALYTVSGDSKVPLFGNQLNVIS